MTKRVLAIGMISHLHQTTSKILKIEDEFTSVDVKTAGQPEQHLIRYGIPVRQPITLSMLVVEMTLATKNINAIHSIEQHLIGRAI